MPHVDANYRFIAAYQEVNARIQQRHQALGLLVSLMLGLFALVVALRPADGAALPAEWLALTFPTASLCFALLNFKAERAISNLRRFLSELERLDDAHLKLPSYNTDPRWASGANRARRFHDWAAAALLASGNLAGLGALLSLHAQRLQQHPLPVIAALLLALVALAVVLLTQRFSYAPAPQG